MVSQFSKDGKYFAHFSSDGKLKIWDATTNSFEQEFTPDYHLTSPCTCLHFVDTECISQNAVTPRKKKRKETAPNIVIGTSSGMLLVYSIAKSDLEYTINSNTSQSISCLTWHAINANLVYSGIAQDIVCWNLNKQSVSSKWKAGNDSLSAILAISKEEIVTASKNIKLWNVKNKTVLKTFTGHRHDISFLDHIPPKSNGDEYIISGSKGDRLLSAWNINPNNVEENAVGSFLMEDIPTYLTVLHESDGITKMLAVTRSGVAHMYQHTLNGRCTKPIKPKTTIQIASDTGQSNAIVAPIPIFGVFFQRDSSLVVVYGSELVLTFENLALSEYEKVQCFLRQDPRTQAKAQEEKGVKIKTPLVSADANYVTPYTASSTSTVKRKNDGAMEVTMEKRLENLTLNKIDRKSKVPRKDNVAQLLVQGLNSKDKVILRSVLTQRDERIIINTIKRLPIDVIIPFVKELTNLIGDKTIMCQVGMVWLRYLVRFHAGILLANPELPDLFAPIIGTVEHRLSLLTPFNKVRGRLDLLISQVGVKSAQSKKDDEVEEEPLLIIADKDSSDSEMETMDITAHSESEHEWSEESDAEEENGEGEMAENHESGSSDSDD